MLSQRDTWRRRLGTEGGKGVIMGGEGRRRSQRWLLEQRADKADGDCCIWILDAIDLDFTHLVRTLKEHLRLLFARIIHTTFQAQRQDMEREASMVTLNQSSCRCGMHVYCSSCQCLLMLAHLINRFPLNIPTARSR